MSQTPIDPTGWDKFLRAVSTVKGRGAIAALTLMLLFFSFWIAIVFTVGALQWVLSLLIIVGLIAFACYVVHTTQDGVNNQQK